MTTHGYFHIELRLPKASRLVLSRSKAFVLLQFQQLLSARLALDENFSLSELATHIDLLAFSIQPDSVRLLVYALSKSDAEDLSRRLITNIEQYTKAEPHSTMQIIRRLSGPHEALQASRAIHLSHLHAIPKNIWRLDYFSSIGFYLYDRRGDWMRLWRLCRIYNNDPKQYLYYLTAARPHVSLTRG